MNIGVCSGGALDGQMLECDASTNYPQFHYANDLGEQLDGAAQAKLLGNYIFDGVSVWTWTPAA